MSGQVEFGKCEICGKKTALRRTYFHYGIKCECHSPEHFELVRHCKDCKPKEPETTKIIVKTPALKELAEIKRKLSDGRLVEVVRCKDCRNSYIKPLGRGGLINLDEFGLEFAGLACGVTEEFVNDDGYCNYGQRKEAPNN